MERKLILVEGPDGVGKTTLCEALVEALPNAVYASFPGREAGTVGKLVYDWHHTPGIEISATALQALHIAAHIDAVERILLPLLESGHIVVLDRSYISTLVYGSVYGADISTLLDLVEAEKMFWASLGILSYGVLQVFISVARPYKSFERGADIWKLVNETYVSIIHSLNETNFPSLILGDSLVAERLAMVQSCLNYHKNLL